MRSIFYNGRVYTGEKTLRQAFLVEDGWIRAVGSDAEVLSLADGATLCMDMAGDFICPGFNDSHMHLLNFGQVERVYRVPVKEKADVIVAGAGGYPRDIGQSRIVRRQ